MQGGATQKNVLWEILSGWKMLGNQLFGPCILEFWGWFGFPKQWFSRTLEATAPLEEYALFLWRISPYIFLRDEHAGLKLVCRPIQHHSTIYPLSAAMQTNGYVSCEAWHCFLSRQVTTRAFGRRWHTASCQVGGPRHGPLRLGWWFLVAIDIFLGGEKRRKITSSQWVYIGIL